MADKKISQLDLAAQINNDAVIPMSQENGGEQTTYKALITALGAKIAEGLTFSNLATTAKNLVGAINEIQAGGGGGGAAILIGTTTPSSSQGSNGNLYIKYTEGVGGADDTVDAIYVKLDGTWCEVTTDYADLLNKPSINNNTLSGNKTNNDLGIYGKTIEMSTTDPDKVADRIEALENNFTLSGLNDTVITSPQAYQMLQFANIGGQLKIVNTSRNAIRHTTVSGTTDATGDILCSDLPLANYQILSAYKNRTISGQSAVGYCILGGNNQTHPYIHIIKSDNTSLASTAVTIEVYYVEI